MLKLQARGRDAPATAGGTPAPRFSERGVYLAKGGLKAAATAYMRFHICVSKCHSRAPFFHNVKTLRFSNPFVLCDLKY